jgi:hypothetical protein
MHACATLALALLVVTAEPPANETGTGFRLLSVEQPRAASANRLRYTRAAYESSLHAGGATNFAASPSTSPSVSSDVSSHGLTFHQPHVQGISHIHGAPIDDACFCNACCRRPRLSWRMSRLTCKQALHELFKPDMPPHTPYRALPAEYYYFRPYNIAHIPPHQEEVVLYGEDPRLPYANTVFDDIYAGLEDEKELPAETDMIPMPPRMPVVPMPTDPAAPAVHELDSP